MGKLLIFLVSTRVILFASLLVANGHFSASVYGERWDGNSYRFIAQNGYQSQGNEGSEFIVFLPLYPALLKLVNFTDFPTEVVAFIVSNIFFVAGGLVLFKLLLLDYNTSFAKKVVVFLAVFPTSYFFSVGYPESLFLFTTVAAFYFTRNNNFLLGFVFAGLAAITRPTGILLFPALLYLAIRSKSNKALVLVSSLLGIIFPIYYLLTNYKLNHSFLSFTYFLTSFWQKSFDFPWGGIIKSFKLTTYQDWDFYQKVTVGISEGTASVAGWVLVFYALVKRLRINFAYSIFTLLSVLLFTSTGFILSAPRYLLSAFPLFIILTFILKNKLLMFLWLTISCLLLLFYNNAFYNGRWAF